MTSSIRNPPIAEPIFWLDLNGTEPGAPPDVSRELTQITRESLDGYSGPSSNAGGTARRMVEAALVDGLDPAERSTLMLWANGPLAAAATLLVDAAGMGAETPEAFDKLPAADQVALLRSVALRGSGDKGSFSAASERLTSLDALDSAPLPDAVKSGARELIASAPKLEALFNGTAQSPHDGWSWWPPAIEISTVQRNGQVMGYVVVASGIAKDDDPTRNVVYRARGYLGASGSLIQTPNVGYHYDGVH